MDKKIIEFRSTVDSDEGYQSKRKILVTTCMIFLAINLTGATLEEANTFIFKIKFTNYHGLNYLFLSTIVFLTIRYYAYAQHHHSNLYNYWAGRLMEDPSTFIYYYEGGEVGGLLGKAVNVCGNEVPGIGDASYCVSGIFMRSLVYVVNDVGGDGEHYDTFEKIALYKFSKKWKFYHYLRLLWVELKFQLEAIFKYRENLDLLAPYLLSATAISSYVFKGYLSAFF